MSQQKIERIDYLDGVRGLAAIFVVFYHFLGGKWSYDYKYNVISMFLNGSDAVSFFFVLSGFVLSYKYLQYNREYKMGSYLYRRIWRLYPAFIFTVIVNYLYWNRHTLGFGTLSDMGYYNSQQLWEELLMVRLHHKFYIPGWTLGVEMALSLLVPFLAIVAKKDIKLFFWILPISILLGPYSSMFVFHFALGIILAYYYPQIKNADFSKHRFYKYRWIIGIITFLLFSIRHIERLWDFGPKYDKLMNILKIDFFHFTGFASFVILIYIINNKRTQEFFANKVMLFLGKISYGVYLMHWIFVGYAMEHWSSFQIFEEHRTIRFFIILFITLFATIVSATFVHYFVEELFMKLSRKKWLKAFFRIP